MLNIIGLQGNLYISYQISGFNKINNNYKNISTINKNSKRLSVFKKPIIGYSKISTQILQISLLWMQMIMNYMINDSDLILMDSQYKINKTIQMNQIYQTIQIILILQIISGYDYTIYVARRPELYMMILTNIIGQIYQINSNDWIITITAWEQMNQSQYLQVTMQGNTEQGSSQSAGIKYFLLSAQTTAFQLMGISIIYGETGATNYDTQISFWSIIDIELQEGSYNKEFFILNVGQFLIFITLMFKLGAAPLHNWAPDLYDSLPTSITMYISIIPKISILTFMLMINSLINHMNIQIFLSIIAIFSILVGSIGLASQWRIKRFITYSAISNIGFLLLAYKYISFDSYILYYFIYGITNILIFTIILVIGYNNNSDDGDISFIIAGLWNMNPFLVIVFSIAILSLAGIPPLIGFFAKLQVLTSIINSYNIWIPLQVISTSVISTVSYLSIIKIISFDMSNFKIKIIVNKNIAKIMSSLTLILILGYLMLDFDQFFGIVHDIYNI